MGYNKTLKIEIANSFVKDNRVITSLPAYNDDGKLIFVMIFEASIQNHDKNKEDKESKTSHGIMDSVKF